MLNLEAKLISIKTECGKNEYLQAQSFQGLLVSGKAALQNPEEWGG